MKYIFLFATVFLASIGQFILKWRLSTKSSQASLSWESVSNILMMLLDPYILIGLFLAFGSSIFWMAALSKYDLSDLYPYMGLSFIIVLMGSSVIFGEGVNLGKLIGTFLIVAGVYICSK